MWLQEIWLYTELKSREETHVADLCSGYSVLWRCLKGRHSAECLPNSIACAAARFILISSTCLDINSEIVNLLGAVDLYALLLRRHHAEITGLCFSRRFRLSFKQMSTHNVKTEC